VLIISDGNIWSDVHGIAKQDIHYASGFERNKSKGDSITFKISFNQLTIDLNRIFCELVIPVYS
jgi:hypothetical protein